MSAVVLASACSTCASASEPSAPKGFKNYVANVARNCKTTITSAIISTIVTGGGIAWLVYHRNRNRDIKLDYCDADDITEFYNKLKTAFMTFRDSLTIINVPKYQVNDIFNELQKHVKNSNNYFAEKYTKKLDPNSKIEFSYEFKKPKENLESNATNDDSKVTLVFHNTLLKTTLEKTVTIEK